MSELGLHIRLRNAGSHALQHPPETFASDGASGADEVQLNFGFDDPQAMHQAGQSLIIVQRVPPDCVGDKAGFARLHLDDRTLVFVGIQIHVFALTHQPVEQPREFREPLDILDARDFARLCFRQLVSFPSLQLGFGFAEEENLALFLVIGIGIKKENRLLLFDSCRGKKDPCWAASPESHRRSWAEHRSH